MYSEGGGGATRTYREGALTTVYGARAAFHSNPYWPPSSFAAKLFHFGHVATQKNNKIQNIGNFRSYNVC